MIPVAITAKTWQSAPMNADDLVTEVEELIDEIESASLDLYGRGNIEALCQVFGGILHGIVCADDAMPEETKASYIAFTIGANLTSVAISHFPAHDIEDRLKAIFDARKVEKLH